MIDFFSSDEFIEPKKGDLLISEPYLPDPHFERTVVLICEHDENGTVGFVLNKSADIGLNKVSREFDNLNNQLYVGGPVEPDTLHFLHRSRLIKKGVSKVSEKISWGGDFDELISLMNSKKIESNEIKFLLGYSGWSSGQLINELNQKSWIVFQNPTESMIFETPAKDLWKHVLRSMGGKFKLISNYPVDPRLN